MYTEFGYEPDNNIYYGQDSDDDDCFKVDGSRYYSKQRGDKIKWYRYEIEPRLSDSFESYSSQEIRNQMPYEYLNDSEFEEEELDLAQKQQQQALYQEQIEKLTHSIEPCHFYTLFSEQSFKSKIKNINNQRIYEEQLYITRTFKQLNEYYYDLRQIAESIQGTLMQYHNKNAWMIDYFTDQVIEQFKNGFREEIALICSLIIKDTKKKMKTSEGKSIIRQVLINKLQYWFQGECHWFQSKKERQSVAGQFICYLSLHKLIPISIINIISYTYLIGFLEQKDVRYLNCDHLHNFINILRIISPQYDKITRALDEPVLNQILTLFDGTWLNTNKMAIIKEYQIEEQFQKMNQSQLYLLLAVILSNYKLNEDSRQEIFKIFKKNNFQYSKESISVSKLTSSQ